MLMHTQIIKKDSVSSTHTFYIHNKRHFIEPFKIKHDVFVSD